MELVRFPFRRFGKEYLGTIWRPYATVMIQGPNQRWVSVEMVVDSGADHTLLPGRYAALLGIDLHACVKRPTAGVGGPEKVYLYKSLTVSLGGWRKRVPVGFLGRDDVPPRLGRLGFLESLDVRFRNRQTIFARP